MNQGNQLTKKYNLYRHYRKQKFFLKWDIIIVAVLIVLLALSIVAISTSNTGEYVEIYYKGKLLEKHSLYQDSTINIQEKGYNQIVIKGGKVFMKKADCKNQVCVHTAPIKKAGQRIICAPNGIVVLIVGKESLDGITGGYQDVN